MTTNEKGTGSLDNAARFLSRLFASCRVWPDGTVIETKEQIAKIGGVTIEIYSKEHAPPHFHVRYSGKKCSFEIENCKRIEGDLSNNQEKIVKYWFRCGGKADLIAAWNRTRPGDCSVGKYGEEMDG